MSVTATVQRVLNTANLNSLSPVLAEVLLGDVLAALATPVSETLEMAAGVVTLTDTPIPGTLVVTGVHSGSPVLLQEQLTGTVAAAGYTRSGKVLTLGSGVANGDSIYVRYCKVVATTDILGTDTGLPV